MHELSIAQSIIKIIEKTVPKEELEKVYKIKIQIGLLSGIEIDALTFSFSIIKKNYAFSEAELEIEIVAGKGRCRSCNNVFAYSAFGDTCPACNSYDVEIFQGKEMRVVSILTY